MQVLNKDLLLSTFEFNSNMKFKKFLEQYDSFMKEDSNLDDFNNSSTKEISRIEEKPRKSKSIKTNQVLADYINELNEDVKLTEYNLREKSLMCSSIWAKWLSYLHLEKENLQRIAVAKKKILANKSSTSSMTDSILKMKSQDKLLENDETLQRLAVLSKQTQDSIDYIERALGILANFGFTIKNTLEVFKMQFTH